MILNDPEMRAQWLKELIDCLSCDELIAVTERIDWMRNDPIAREMRKLLKEKLEKVGVKGNWDRSMRAWSMISIDRDHVTKQIGMFTFTGLNKELGVRLNKEQSEAMVAEHHALA